MPRTARKKSSTGIYHIMLRGINGQPIFIDNEDNEKFLRIIGDCKATSEFELYGYCLMVNHVHLLIKEGKESLDLVLKRIGTRYVYWHNSKYSRCGHLFQDRYRSEAVESDRYFTTVLRYIHQNPKKAGLCKSIDEYPWSSYNDYFSKAGIIDCALAGGIIGASNFFAFMNDSKDENCMEYKDKEKRISDDELVSAIEERFSINAIMIKKAKRETMNDILRKTLMIEGVSTRQLSRVTGISANTIWRL